MCADLSGRKFGCLTVVQPGRVDARYRRYWLCRCSCGVVKQVRSDGLVAGSVVSCGHFGRERRAIAITKPMPAGARYGRLVILRRVRSVRKRGHVYECRCACGKRVEVQGRHLRSGETRSCGCWFKDTRATSYRHGHARVNHETPEYSAFGHAKSVCNNPNDKAYYCIGARGIKFLFADFIEFLAEVGLRPGPDYRLRRGDRDDHFQAGNVAWVPIRRKCRRR